MNLNGIYFSAHYWPRYNTLWAYRFYADGAVLFTYADPVGRFVLQSEAGPIVCHPEAVLGNKSRVSEFVRCFTSGAPMRIVYRSGLPGITQGRYNTDGTTVSICHPYFQKETCQLSGQILPDRLILTLTGTSLTQTGEKKSLRQDAQVFLRLDE